MQWNEWYSNVESTLEVYVGVNDIHQINSSNKLGIKKVNRVGFIVNRISKCKKKTHLKLYSNKLA